jgi:hypothetical protein
LGLAERIIHVNRKDFDLVSKALKGAKPPSCDSVERAGWFAAVEALADALAAGCAHFDRDKFIARCGAVI